jgi:hypothetical protein
VGGRATVRLYGKRLPSAAHHVAAILLTDARSGVPIALDYRTDTSLRTDAGGRIAGIALAIPPATRLPRRLRAYVIVDSFPVGQSLL